MSKSNRTARQELERICGKGCFFARARCEKKIEQIGGIKTFKTFIKERKFRGRKISHQITFHHLKHKSEGGETTIENGANVEEIAHQYIHSLPREQEELINDMIREFKLGYAIISDSGIKDAGAIQLDFEVADEDILTIQVFDGGKDEYLQQQEQRKKKKEKYQRLKNPTRAMKKRELQKLVEEEEWDYDEH